MSLAVTLDTNETIFAAEETPEGVERREEEDARGHEDSLFAKWKNCPEPSASWTACHSAYMFFFGFMIPTGVCFGVNYGVATAIFRSNVPPTLWGWESVPIAGDFAMIVLIQQIVNWLLAGTLQQADILNGLVAPLQRGAISWWPDKNSRWEWWLQGPELLISPRTEPNKSCCARLKDSIYRALPWILYGMVFVWPIFTGVSYAIWGSKGYNSYPQPEFMCATYGGTLALITTPPWTLMTMISIGQRIHDERTAASLSGSPNTVFPSSATIAAPSLQLNNGATFAKLEAPALGQNSSAESLNFSSIA